MRIHYIIAATAAAFALFACRPPETPTLVRTGELHFPGGQWEPDGLAFASDGRVFVADISFASAVEVFDAAGVYAGALGGPGKGPGRLMVPTGVAVGPGDAVYVAEFGTRRVSVFAANGFFLRTMGAGALRSPLGVAVDRRGTVYVADAGAGGVVVFPRGTENPAVWGKEKGVSAALDVTVAADGRVAVAAADDPRPIVLASRTYYATPFPAPGMNAEVAKVAFDAEGNLFALTRETTPEGAVVYAVVKYDVAGKLAGKWTVPLTTPGALAVARDGTVVIADAGRHEVAKYRAPGVPPRRRR
jgi:DNA-binding beta-propeller fold protein YncE